ncbi:GNAT family N-acetyltransferase [Phycicoccus endophyticus]|uniref:GNAT family N-acetyltransferase n=1 Tax=Phycicoccus endophyticus TaxID=1690220 RepID=A0A7G9R1K2_9MICO|nr:GNAT family N-acetyltransferase [Phycicoccus endophyticus]NHI18733.1 GNAT family N-acetyltransferase [Phycicoccus endophyticus]QNN49477.1 GNAT family N-acetyltransferase [Phycicoccus endophyticus]GGL36923.1 N-acetyltransferase [Phycicoccus endophyticus]
MQLVVRPAREGELAAVGALAVEAYAADGQITAEHPYAATLLDTASRARDAVLLVAVAGDAMLGTVTYVPPGTPFAEVGGPDEAEVRMLAVSPSARGRGVGRLLSDECVRRARADGCAALVLSSGSWMHAAHRLYERMGFVRTPERDWSPRPEVDLLAYRLPV